MLKRMLYDHQFFIKILFLMTGILIIGGYGLISPALELNRDLQVKINDFPAFEGGISEYPKENIISIDALRNQFELSVVQKDSLFYFSGSTQNVVALLEHLLVNAYPLTSFDLQIKAYKSLLVIVL